MIICYDDTYWEPARVAALKGCDMIAYICSSDRLLPQLGAEAAGKHSTIAAVQHQSAWNGLAMIAADRNNAETNPTTGVTVTYGGSASIWQADGERIAHASATDYTKTMTNKPSIIYGMFGLFVFAPIYADYLQVPLQSVLGGLPLVGWLFGGAVTGLGILAAGIILAFMVLPFVAAVMRDVFEITPPILRESAYGLGCTTWEVVRKVVLPYTQKGVIGGIMLGLGRALGETMAVTFVIGNANRLPTSLFSPGTSIASVLANEFGEAGGLHFNTLFALGFLLFCITFVVLFIAKWMINRAEKAKGF
jgi:ABC-type phosphate transport system permease subunit